MANRINLRSTLGGGVGSAASNTAYNTFHDNGDGTFDEAIGAHMYYFTGGQWTKWDGTTTGGGGGGGTSSAFNSTFPANGTAAGASDGTNMKPLLVDGSGFLKVNVSAGGGAGGTSSSFAATFPATGTAAGFSDGTNMQSPRVFDGDSGAGTQYVLGINLRQVASGGTVEAGIAANPIRVDPTGTTTQPVSIAATVGVTQSTSPWVTNDPGLPDTLGQKTMAGSTGVVLASDQSSIPVAATLSAETTKVIGTVNQGTSPWVTNDPGLPDTLGQKTMANSTGVVLASDQSSIPVAATLSAETTKVIGVTRSADGSGNLLTSTTGALDVNLKTSALSNQTFNLNQVAGTAVDVNSGNKSAGTLRVTLATDQVQLTNALKVDGSGVTQPVSIASINLSPSTTGGWSVSTQTALTTTATVSGGAGKFGGFMFINLNSAPAYIQVFDTTGAVTLGTTVPTFVIPIPANSTPANGSGGVQEIANGINITAGIKIAATTTPTGASTVATALTGFVMYK